MTKELSIENIKKELIDKISNNSDIFEYFESMRIKARRRYEKT